MGSKQLEAYHFDKIDAGREEEKQNDNEQYDISVNSQADSFLKFNLPRCIIRNQSGLYLQTLPSFGLSLEHTTTTLTLPHNKHIMKELPTSSSRHSNANRSSSRLSFGQDR